MQYFLLSEEDVNVMWWVNIYSSTSSMVPSGRAQVSGPKINLRAHKMVKGIKEIHKLWTVELHGHVVILLNCDEMPQVDISSF